MFGFKSKDTVYVQRLLPAGMVSAALLPLFFLLHTANSFNLPLLHRSFLFFLISMWLMELLLFLIFRVLFRQADKALAASLLLTTFYFLFPPLHDGLERLPLLSFLSKYSVLLPMLFAIFLLFIRHLRKRPAMSPKSFQFSSFLLILLLLIDGMQFAYKTGRSRPLIDEVQIEAEAGCKKPDIYLIIADEYAGEEQLRTQLGFNNSTFIDSLQHRGFRYISNTRSNYHYTVHSLASLLNLQLLRPDVKNYRDEDFFPLRAAIEQNNLSRFLKTQGYQVYSFSAVDLSRDHEQQADPYLLTVSEFLHQQTTSGRIMRDLGERFRSEKTKKDQYWYAHRNNELFVRKTMEVAKTRGRPKFVYTHLDLPHQPYYFDSSGQAMPFPNEGSISDRYKNYLLYANRKLLAVIDHILANSASPPVMVLLSDHGFRHLPPPAAANYFMNLAAVLTPGPDEKEFYSGISNVNIMRVLLNKTFKTKLPLIADTSFLLAGRGKEFEAY